MSGKGKRARGSQRVETPASPKQTHSLTAAHSSLFVTQLVERTADVFEVDICVKRQSETLVGHEFSRNAIDHKARVATNKSPIVGVRGSIKDLTFRTCAYVFVR